MITTPEMLMPLVSAFCAAARACCMEGGDIPVKLGDCESTFATKHDTARSLERGVIAIDQAGLAQCLAAYEAAATSCAANPVLKACAGLVTGKLAEGAACETGAECAAAPGPNACLFADGDDETGICKQTPHGKVGDPCSFTCRPGENCNTSVFGATDSTLAVCFEDEDVYCHYPDEAGEVAKCEAILPVGAVCEDDDQCGYFAECDLNEGKCKARGREGDDCGRCISELSCIEGKCKSPPFASYNTCEGRSLGPY